LWTEISRAVAEADGVFSPELRLGFWSGSSLELGLEEQMAGGPGGGICFPSLTGACELGLSHTALRAEVSCTPGNLDAGGIFTFPNPKN
jgi:hypothetical protein